MGRSDFYKPLGRYIRTVILIIAAAVSGGLTVSLFVNLISLAGLLGVIWPLLVLLTLVLYALEPSKATTRMKRFGGIVLEEGRKYLALAVVGLTPQFVFLIVLNWRDGEYAGGWLESVLHEYDSLAVETYEQAERVNSAAWYWWLLAVASVAIASWMLRRPWIFRFGNQLRSILSAVTVVSVVACSFVMSTVDVAVTEARLRTVFKRSVHHAVVENLGQELRNIVIADPQFSSSISAYAKTFGDIHVEPVFTRDGLVYPSVDDMREARTEVLHSIIKIDVSDSVEGSNAQQSQEDGKRLPVVYIVEKASREQEADLEVKSTLVKDAVIAFVGQKILVPPSEIPLVQEILNELFSITAENLTKNILDRVPVRDGVAAGDQLGRFIRQKIAIHYDKVVSTLLTPPLNDALRGSDSKLDLAELLRARSELVREQVRTKMLERVAIRKAVGEAVRRAR